MSVDIYTKIERLEKRLAEISEAAERLDLPPDPHPPPAPPSLQGDPLAKKKQYGWVRHTERDQPDPVQYKTEQRMMKCGLCVEERTLLVNVSLNNVHVAICGECLVNSIPELNDLHAGHSHSYYEARLNTLEDTLRQNGINLVAL